MRYLIFPILSVFFFSCTGNEKEINTDSLKTDSILKIQQTQNTPTIGPPVATNPDTIHQVALPSVFEGDIIMINLSDPQSLDFGKATKSKYNHAGIIFIRPKDQVYAVLDCHDSVRGTPLSEWVKNGKDGHMVILRLKNSNQILNEKKTKRLKQGGMAERGKKYDPYFSWSDDAMYSTELVYKVYKNSINIPICETGLFSDLDLTSASVKSEMKKKYGDKLPLTEPIVTPESIMKSPKLEIIYER